MPIPTTRAELLDLVTTSYTKLRDELDTAGPGIADVACTDDWSVKDLLAIRAWWTEAVVGWVEAGRRGEEPTTPAEGYKWTETPRLNADLVEAARGQSLEDVRGRLDRGVERVLATIDALDDRELLETGVFAWADKWPVSRWISINTARQYATARTTIRRAIRENASGA